MRASKHQKGDKADIPAPENKMTSSPSQQDDQNKESSINNKEKHQVNEQKDVPCPSSTPDQTQSDGKGPDKIDRRASVEEIQDEDDIPGPNHDGNGDNDDIKSNKDDREKSASTAAAVIYTAFTETNISGKDPKSLKEAMNSPKWPEWEKAIQTELEMLQ